MRTVGNRASGFTIVETLIVLAVSSVLAVSAMVLVGGRQNKTEFQVAANSMKQRIEQIINETSSGYYPSNNDFSCNGTTNPITITKTAPNASKQGTNNTCIFLGKAIAFGVGATGADARSFIVYPLVAKRYVGVTTTEVSSFTDARPIALATDLAGNPIDVNYAVNGKTQNGLTLHHAQYSKRTAPTPAYPNGQVVALPSKNYAVLALADQLGQYAVQSDGTLNSATLKLDLFDYDVPATWPISAPGSRRTVSNINAFNIDTTNVIENLKLCYTSGGTKQSALITISGRGQLAVSLKVYGNTDCS